MKKMFTSLSLSAALLLGASFTASAATSTWSGNADTFWTTLGNWDTAPTGGEDILFPNVTGQTVDLGAGIYAIGTLNFNAPDAYSVANGQLTLGGDVTQSGAGAVALNSTTDLGGATRVFNGTSSGVVTFGGPVTGAGFRASLNGGNHVIANSANTIDRWEITNGATAVLLSSPYPPDYPASSVFGGDGVGGGFFVNLNGGTLNDQLTDTVTAPGGATPATTTGNAGWADRAIVFGPNGGALVYNTTPPCGSPSVWFSQGGTSTLVVGQPLPYSGDWTADNNNFRSPFEVEYGVSLGIFQNSSYTYPGAPLTYKWRQGSGDFQLILTNGASAYLDWNAMTNGNFIIRGHPGGDSSVIETNATGWTRNVGRFAIRGPHRSGVQYSDANYPAGTVSRSFFMDQPYGMVFYDAVQVWSRDGLERLACDMSFESSSSVDFCSGRRTQVLDLGHPACDTVLGFTNTLTIKGGGKLNLNLQMRSQIGDGGTGPRGYSAGLRVWANIDIKDGGELRIYRSQTNCVGLNEVAAGDTGGNAGRAATKCIELFRPILGSGNSASDAKVVVDLPFSPSSGGSKDGGGSAGVDGVNFNGNVGFGAFPGADLIVNGTGDYGLRIQGQGSYVSNLLANGRTDRLSGSGGTLTVASSTSDTLWIPGGPTNTSGAVSLGLDSQGGSTPTYLLTGTDLGNYAGLILKGGTAAVGDSTTVAMKTLRLAGSAGIQLGTGAGGAILNFANSSAVAWHAGTLTISSWNGSASGGGSDQIKFGSDATGLTAGQRAQIKWINPYGGGDVTGALILSTGEIVPVPPSIWSGSADTFWSNAGNWNAAPNPGDNILFPNVSGQTVDLGAGTYGIGSLTFDAPDAYSLGNGGLTLGGNVSQNGSGPVTLNVDLALGGTDRVFGGSGTGVVTLNNPITGDNNLIVGAGEWIIANPANTLNQIVVTNGGKVVFQGTAEMAEYPNASYFGGNGTSGGGYVRADGGVIDYQQYYTAAADDPVNVNTQNFLGYWNAHGINFGPDGGTLLLNKDYPVDQGPTFYFSSATNTGGTIVVGFPLPFTGDGRNGTNFVGPFDVPSWGLNLGPAGNDGYGAEYARRHGEGDLTIVMTNGATAFLQWSVMTNGNLILKGQPGGNSAVAEVDGNGTTTNVGRFVIRGVHRGLQQPGYTGAFYLNQPNAVHFYDALQVWPRENRPNLACDMVFESGSSVDFAGGKNDGRPLRLGYPTGNGGATATNNITIKGGAKVNLNAQLRTQHWEGNGPTVGDTSILGVFSFVTIEDNGELKMYRTQTNSTGVRVIELFRPITGLGTTANDARMIVNLPFADNSLSTVTAAGLGGTGGGINFNGLWGGPETFPGADLIVNGAGDYGLRIQGAVTNLWNVMANGRYGRISGSGGTLTLAADNNETLDVDGPTNVNCAVSLGLDSQGGSTPTYNLRAGFDLQNYAGLIFKGGTAAVGDSSTVTMKTLRLAGSAGIQLGTGAGGAILNFANSSAVAWNTGTLTISSWNGSASGGGSDQIKFGGDATGLTAGQLAQIKWITPNGGADVTGAQILSTGEIVPAATNPTTIGAPALVGGNFVFQVNPGSPSQTSVVQWATNLTSPVVWLNILTNTGTFSFTNSANLPESYYRVLVP